MEVKLAHVEKCCPDSIIFHYYQIWLIILDRVLRYKVNKVSKICDVVKVVNLKVLDSFILTVKFNRSYDFVSYICILTNVNHVSEQIYIFADNCIRSRSTHTCLIRSMNVTFSPKMCVDILPVIKAVFPEYIYTICFYNFYDLETSTIDVLN